MAIADDILLFFFKYPVVVVVCYRCHLTLLWFPCIVYTRINMTTSAAVLPHPPSPAPLSFFRLKIGESEKERTGTEEGHKGEGAKKGTTQSALECSEKLYDMFQMIRQRHLFDTTRVYR